MPRPTAALPRSAVRRSAAGHVTTHVPAAAAVTTHVPAAATDAVTTHVPAAAVMGCCGAAAATPTVMRRAAGTMVMSSRTAAAAAMRHPTLFLDVELVALSQCRLVKPRQSESRPPPRG